MFDKARARLSGDTDAPPFGCPLDHSCLARLRVYPEDVLELVSGNGDDDRAILSPVYVSTAFLGDLQMRIVRAGEVVRVPPELSHRIEDIGEPPLRLDWLAVDSGSPPRISP